MTLEGVIEEIIFRNDDNGYTVFEFDAEGMGVITAVGYTAEVSDGERVSVTGKWIVHPEYGEQFKVEYYNENLEKVVEEFDRFGCRMVQHELSHLEGNLFVDNISPIRRKMIMRKLQAISKGTVQTRYKSKK